MSDMRVTCFTDIKGSTELTERLGNEGMKPLREEHHRVGELLAAGVDGEYHKDTGDGNMVTFISLEAAFHYATQLQQYHAPQPCYDHVPIGVKIGLYLGAVDPEGGDAHGSGVNRAARVTELAKPGQVLLNKELVESISRAWSEKKAKRYLRSVGEYELKGVTDKQELFEFDWLNFGKDNPKDSLAQLVYDHLNEAKIIHSNLSSTDLATPSTVIWPVVPRELVNAIHRGQIEIIRLLALIGWKVQILIADCGVKENFNRTDSDKFKSLIDNHLRKRRIKEYQINFMSDLYRPKSDCCHTIHEYFQQVITDLTFQELWDINIKDYKKEDEKDAIEKSATLDFLRPALTIAAILRITKGLAGKCIVVVGHDENKQWTRAHEVPESSEKFGVLFNPVLNEKEGHQARQGKNWPYWYSFHSMVMDMSKYNLAQWTSQLHAYLPAFPAKSFTINGKQITVDLLQNGDELEKNISKEALAKHVFDTLLSI